MRHGERLFIGMMALACGILMFGIVLDAVTAEQSQPVAQCYTEQEKDRTLALAQAAIDDAFKEHVKNLFEIWVRDQSDQPKRAMTGMAKNLLAYQHARASALQWQPVICTK